MKMFVTKHALTERGVFEVSGKPGRGDRADYFWEDGCCWGMKIGRDCHPTREEAVVVAEAMRAKKIASLRKQIAKLEKLTF